VNVWFCQNVKSSEPVRLLALLSLGEIGRHVYVYSVLFVIVVQFYHTSGLLPRNATHECGLCCCVSEMARECFPT